MAADRRLPSPLVADRPPPPRAGALAGGSGPAAAWKLASRAVFISWPEGQDFCRPPALREFLCGGSVVGVVGGLVLVSGLPDSLGCDECIEIDEKRFDSSVVVRERDQTDSSLSAVSNLISIVDDAVYGVFYLSRGAGRRRYQGRRRRSSREQEHCLACGYRRRVGSRRQGIPLACGAFRNPMGQPVDPLRGGRRKR